MTSKVAPVWVVRLALLAMIVLGLSFIGAARWDTDEKTPATSTSQEAGKPPSAEHGSNHLWRGFWDLVAGLGEALVIAALLGLAVDPYVKFHLGKEIGQEIAKETLGQHLPVELREELERIQDIHLYVREMTVDVVLGPSTVHDGFLVWCMTIRYEVENASWFKRNFEHRVSIADSDAARADGKITKASHYVNGECKYELDGSSPQFVNMCKKEDGVTSFTHKDKYKIPSGRQDVKEKNVYSQTTERLVPDSEVQVIQPYHPTVGITLTVQHPEGITIATSLQAVDEISLEIPNGQKGGQAGRWRSKRAYLPNEHIWIMYEIDKKEEALKEGQAVAAPRPAEAPVPPVSPAKA